MTRPPSIVRFEALYLFGLALSLAGWALSWGSLERRLALDPRTASIPWLWWFLPAGLLLSVAVTLLLWWLTARRASRVGKWLVTIFATLSAIRLAINLPALTSGIVPLPMVILSFATTIVGILAAVMLFADDARVWFGEAGAETRA